jgi:hypothetical protein
MKINYFGIDDKADFTPITIRQKRRDELELEYESGGGIRKRFEPKELKLMRQVNALTKRCAGKERALIEAGISNTFLLPSSNASPIPHCTVYPDPSPLIHSPPPSIQSYQRP